MSIQTMCWVLEHSDARLGKRLVLLSLANHAHTDGSNAFPGVATIARETRMSRRNVQYALRELEASGAIVRTGDRRGTNVYRVVTKGAQKTTAGAQNTTPDVSDFAPEPSGAVNDPALTLNVAEGRGEGEQASNVVRLRGKAA